MSTAGHMPAEPVDSPHTHTPICGETVQWILPNLRNNFGWPMDDSRILTNLRFAYVKFSIDENAYDYVDCHVRN